MKLKTKVWLLTASVVSLIVTLDFFLGFQRIESAIKLHLEQEAEDIRGLLMSMRKVYQKEFLESEITITRRTIGLLPAHAFSKISKEFNGWSRSGLTFNNVSDRPRNPSNLANDEEQEAMSWFRNHPEATERMVELRSQDDRSTLYHFSAPIWVEQHCLKCHGKREDAPIAISNQSDDLAFGYRKGELRGLISIHLPTHYLRDIERTRWLQGFYTRLGGYFILILLIGFFLERFVIARLERLKTATEAMAKGNYGVNPEIHSNDEVGILAQSLTAMGRAIGERDALLRESEERYRSTSENMNDPLVVISGDDGIVMHWNRAAAEVFGYCKEEALGQPIHELIAFKDDLSGMAEALKEFTHRGTGKLIGTTTELRARHRNGQAIFIELSISAMQVADTWQAIAVIRDISTRKEREQDDFYARRGAEIKFAFAAALQQSDKTFTQRVDEALRIFAQQPGFICPHGGVRLILKQDESGVCDSQIGDARWQGETPEPSGYQVKVVDNCTRNQPAHGHYIITLHYGSEHLGAVIIDTPVNPPHHPACISAMKYVGECLSIAIVNERTRELAEAAMRNAEMSSRSKSEFLATMSHEIRTPLNGILGTAQLLLTDDINTDERLEFARIILNSGNTLLTLLNDILDFSKIEAGRLEITDSIYSPTLLALEVIALFAELAAEKGLVIEHSIAQDVQENYVGDPVRLRQILSNLISNAIKFTDAGVVSVRIETFMSDEQDLLRFSVTDTGSGISLEAQEHLFQPFTQVDGSNTRVHGGSGLGLSIVRSLVSLMGGEVGVSSTLGHGASFWFSVLARRVTEGSNRRQGPRISDRQPESTIETSKACSRTVLLVEDNEANRRVAQAMLKKIGYVVLMAENGLQAIEKACISNGRPDVILMDCQMPVLDGLEATRRIRAWERESGTRVPIVALTAGAFEADRENCLDAGMDDFLTKPINYGLLEATLKQWISSQTNLPWPPKNPKPCIL